jgi:hypothetical protein
MQQLAGVATLGKLAVGALQMAAGTADLARQRGLAPEAAELVEF